MKIFIIFSMICLSSQAIFGRADQGSVKLLNRFQISLSKNENFFTSQSAKMQTGIFTSKSGKVLFLAKDYPPQSILSIKKRAAEEGVKSDKVKMLRWKDRSLFYFETKDFVNVFSTNGGHLLISKKVSTQFDISKIYLLPKYIKKVASL